MISKNSAYLFAESLSHRIPRMEEKNVAKELVQILESVFELEMLQHHLGGLTNYVKNDDLICLLVLSRDNPHDNKKSYSQFRIPIDFSYGIEDPHDDVQKTGDAVLGIWNGRVDIAQAHHSRIRVNVLVRNYELTEFVMYEEYLEHFRISDYEWRENERGNLEGFHKRTGEKCFTWQPHGSQFTIHSVVPDDAIKFRVKRPPLLTQETALDNIGFDESWIEIL